MINWKIAAAALVIIAAFALFLGGSGTGSFFSGITEQVGKWLENSPLGGFFASPKTEQKIINITIYPDNFTFTPSNKINVSISSTYLQDFAGSLNINFAENVVRLNPEKSDLQITAALQPFEISSIEITDLKIIDERFDAGNLQAGNGTVEISNFKGSMAATQEKISFLGNTTKVKITMDNRTWELE